MKKVDTDDDLRRYYQAWQSENTDVGLDRKILSFYAWLKTNHESFLQYGYFGRQTSAYQYIARFVQERYGLDELYRR